MRLTFPVVFPLAAATIDECIDRRRMVAAMLAVACTWAAQLTFDWWTDTRIWIVYSKDIVFAMLCLAPAGFVVVSHYRAVYQKNVR